MTGIVFAVTLALLSMSYGRALLAPGYATWTDKTSSWIRDNGGGRLLDAYENWRYAAPPSDSQPDLHQYVAPVAIPGGSDTTAIHLAVLPSVPGQSAPVWTSGRADVHGVTRSYTSVFQPDPEHRSVVAGVAIVAYAAVSAHLVPGTSQPGGDAPGDAHVPATDIPSLVAVFNSGFKMNDIDGGFYLDGTAYRPLRDGQASAVVDSAGHLRVEQWGRDDAMGPSISAVRQNLALIVDHGAAVEGLDVNSDNRWGSAQNQLQYTQRSALGTTASGDLIYIAGGAMNLSTLARALVDAGAVTGMELDIHSGMTMFSSWVPDMSGVLAPTTLMPDIQQDPNRYLAPDRRDFFYITLSEPTPQQSSVFSLSVSSMTTAAKFDGS
ncbi:MULTISPECIES: phosphodiester glycosidase family protein [unclassified Rhodococcus (in: high G+C Gram-positive bacteria)]|uniref:phosphodiester glycosidase family protein n=1 Tax=unclassified Rhodococcus (in: high G+C Gram-positive bacteria) TaxID=192944 RepID=UPI00067E6AEB|nr:MULTISPECIES: phosphodiester glycosidase family protein [unclassified Rhodococcus (in: high G+C Gram-positive bacteria)]